MSEEERRDHVAWHQIVRNMNADEAVSYLSVLWQCYHIHNQGRFVTKRAGFYMPSPTVHVNPMSFPAQLKAFEYLFGHFFANPKQMAKAISRWIDRTVDVEFIDFARAA